jgi:hypothetical protein
MYSTNIKHNTFRTFYNPKKINFLIYNMILKILILIFLTFTLNSCLISGVEYTPKNYKSKNSISATYHGGKNAILSMDYSRGYRFLTNDTCSVFTYKDFVLRFEKIDTLTFDTLHVKRYYHNNKVVTYKNDYIFKNSYKYLTKKKTLFVTVNYQLDSCGVEIKRSYKDTLYRDRYFEFSVH